MTAVITGNNELVNSSRYYFQGVNATILAVRVGKLRQGGGVVG